MKKKTIFWIVGIILLLSYFSCKGSWLGSHSVACGYTYTDENGNPIYNSKGLCALWRNLGLINCSSGVGSGTDVNE